MTYYILIFCICMLFRVDFSNLPKTGHVGDPEDLKHYFVNDEEVKLIMDTYKVLHYSNIFCILH